MKRDLLITIDQSRRPYSASGVSLYVSDKRRRLDQVAGVPWPGWQPGKMNCGPLVLDAMRGSGRNNGG